MNLYQALTPRDKSFVLASLAIGAETLARKGVLGSSMRPTASNKGATMRWAKSTITVGFALVAIGALNVPTASAEPAILCLEACMGTLEIALTAPTGGLVVALGGDVLSFTVAQTKIESCEEIAGSTAKDTNLCKNRLLTLTGAKFDEMACRSEMTNGEGKDAPGTILAYVDWHLAAEDDGLELEPLFLGKVLGTLLGEEELQILCGVRVVKMRGTFGCLLLPGLKEIAANGRVELLCEIDTDNDPETGECLVLCDWFEKTPLEARFGEKFEDAWPVLKMSGPVTKDIFVDD